MLPSIDLDHLSDPNAALETNSGQLAAAPTPSDAAEWMNSKPKLRSDLRFFPQRSNGKSVIVIEDPIRSKFFRIGRCEYLFISMLNGENSVSEAYDKALEKSANAVAEFDLELGQTEQICKFLSNAQLIRVADLQSIQYRVKANDKAKLLSRFNPIFQKLPLAHPTKLLEQTQTIGNLLFSTPMLFVWISTLAIAGYSISNHWTEFSAASAGILSGNRWLWLLGIWVMMKGIHEFGHAAACHRFGGHVRETGLAFICFFPVAYVDVSSSWRFGSKWHRMTVAAAGIYAELWIAAVAAIAWCWVSDSIIRDLLYNITIVSSVTTIFFNANPLMKFDGYFVLSDYLESPSLFQKSQKAVQAKLGWLVLGNKPAESNNLFALSYGVAIIAWRIAMCIGIFIAVSLIGEGLGLILAIVAAAFWIYPLISSGIRSLSQPTQTIPWKRLCLSGTLATGSIACIGLFLFVPQRVVAPGIINFAELQIVRTAVSGFVEELHVIDGQEVKIGDPLISLRNESVRNQLAQAKLSYQQAINRIENHRSSGSFSEVASETKMLRKLRADIAHYEKQVAGLVLRAEINGFVQMRDATTLLDSFVKSENEIMLISQPDQKEIVVAIPQYQFDGLSNRNHGMSGSNTKLTGHLFVSEIGQLHCHLKNFEPRATVTTPDILLCANVGGSIPVKNAATPPNSEGSELENVQFLSPHVIAKFEIAPEIGERLHAGQRVNVILQAKATSIGYQFYKGARRWLKHKYAMAIDSAN